MTELGSAEHIILVPELPVLVPLPHCALSVHPDRLPHLVPLHPLTVLLASVLFWFFFFFFFFLLLVPFCTTWREHTYLTGL